MNNEVLLKCRNYRSVRIDNLPDSITENEMIKMTINFLNEYDDINIKELGEFSFYKNSDLADLEEMAWEAGMASLSCVETEYVDGKLVDKLILKEAARQKMIAYVIKTFEEFEIELSDEEKDSLQDDSIYYLSRFLKGNLQMKFMDRDGFNYNLIGIKDNIKIYDLGNNLKGYENEKGKRFLFLEDE